jgi:tetratricopeptide (TPR) repeat protein
MDHLWEQPELVGTPEEILPRQHLIHVLSCYECREWLLTYLLDEGVGDEETQETLYAAAWGSLDESFEEARRAADERRAETEGLLGELLVAPADERLQRVREERFQRLDLLDLLLELSHDSQLSNPAQSLSLAELAARLAADLSDIADDAGHGLSKAFCLAANALRLQGDLPRAEAQLGKAAPFLATTNERAFYCRVAALVRWEEGRSAEALALLEHASRIFQAEGPHGEAEVCLGLLGLLLFEQNQVPQALPRLYKAWKRVDRDSHPQLVLQVGLSVAIAFALAQQPGNARQVRSEAWKLYSKVTRAEDTIRIYGLEGRLLAVLGEYEEAEEMLESVRRKLLEEQRVGDATLVAVDLGMVLVSQGKADKLAALVESMEKTVEAIAPLGVAVVALMSLANEPIREDFQPWEWQSASRVALLRSIRAVGLPLCPLPFA